MLGNLPFGAFPFSDFPGNKPFSVTFSTGVTANANLSYQIFTSTAEFITAASDTPANQPFNASITEPIDFKWSALGNNFITGFSTGTGELILNNSDGSYDFLPQHYSISGRVIEIRYGRIKDPYPTWALAFRGTASDFFTDEKNLTFELQDNGYKFTVPLQTNTYGGTGGIDGGSNLAGKRKPKAYGYVLNVTPPLIDPNHYVYQVNDGPISAVTAVYDTGVPLNFYQDFATSALLIASVAIPGGDYATCLAEGMFRIVFQVTPTGSITADVSGDNFGAVFPVTTASIIKRIVKNQTTLRDADLFLPAFTAFDALQPAQIGYWADQNDTSTVQDVVARLMNGVGGWGGFRRDGKFYLMRLDIPVGPPNLVINNIDIISIARGQIPAGITPPPAKWQVGYQQNFTVQSQPAGVTTVARRSFIAEQYRYATADDESIRFNYPFSKDPTPIAAYFVNLADAQTEANRLLATYRLQRSLYTITVGVRTAVLQDLGQIVNATFNRWDLKVGKNLAILEISQSGTADTIEMKAYG